MGIGINSQRACSVVEPGSGQNKVNDDQSLKKEYSSTIHILMSSNQLESHQSWRRYAFAHVYQTRVTILNFINIFNEANFRLFDWRLEQL